MTRAIIIPARYASSRFPGKPLVSICGKPMIEWVISTACRSKLASKVIVATDDERIYDFVNKLTSQTIEACLTLKSHNCGTDRIAEVAKKYPDIDYVVNLQGDEPLMPSEYIDKVLEQVLHNKNQMASLIAPITHTEELNNPNIVKVVMDKDNYGLYFSRSPIPHNRTSNLQLPISNLHFRHLGIYAYTRETLLHLNLLPQSQLEQIEQLEQLRALENGIRIKLQVVPKAYPAIDRPEDIKLVEGILRHQHISK